jgi:hypothetical protein
MVTLVRVEYRYIIIMVYFVIFVLTHVLCFLLVFFIILHFLQDHRNFISLLGFLFLQRVLVTSFVFSLVNLL